MDQQLWQEATIVKLSKNFIKDEDIITFAIFGSTANTENKVPFPVSRDVVSAYVSYDKFDFWSDIDGLLVVEDDSFKKFSDNLKWIEYVGKIYAYQCQPGEHLQTYRLVFEDFKKIDLVIVKKSAVDVIIQPHSGPYWKEINVLFSKSEEITQKIKNTKKENIKTSFTEQLFKDLVNDFWFIASLALYKVIRNDLLIAQHLALDLYKDCLMLGMILRDREMDTNIHKTGGMGNDIAKNLELSLEKISQINLLNLVDNCGKEFDRLCIKWNKNFLSKHSTLHQYMQKAKSEIDNEL